jgi:hypothetical protein
MANIGFIYKITNKINDKFYIGSTSKTLKKRFKQHYTKSNTINDRDYNMPIYRCMRELGRDNFKIRLVEAIEYDDKSELLKKEALCIIDQGFSLNEVLPYVSPEDRCKKIKKWFSDNKEHVIKYKAEYYKKNIDNIKIKMKEHYIENSDKIKANVKKWCVDNKEKHDETKRIYREANKEEIARKAKIWREDNKERLLDRKKIKETCECGHIGLKCTMARHRRSATHLKAME